MIPDPSNPFGYTVFCDDIRYELGGKLSLMGAYAGKILIANRELPIIMPQLGVLVNYRQSVELEYLPVRFTLEASWLELPIVEWTINNWPEGPIQKPEDEDHFFLTMTMPLSLPAFEIKEEGKIRSRAHRGGQEIRLGSLQIELVDNLPGDTPELMPG